MTRDQQLEHLLWAILLGVGASFLGAFTLAQGGLQEAINYSLMWVFVCLMVGAFGNLLVSTGAHEGLAAFMAWTSHQPPAQEEPDPPEPDEVAEPAPPRPVVEKVKPVVREKLYSALAVLINRHYDGLPLTRASCLADRVVDQRYWNVANSILATLGLRSGETYLGVGRQEDLELAMRSVVLTSQGRRIWVRRPDSWADVPLIAPSDDRTSGRSSSTTSP